MPLTVFRNELTAEFGYTIINQACKEDDLDDNFIANANWPDDIVDDEPPMTDMLHWTNNCNWNCDDTTINWRHGLRWTFESANELAEFLLLFSLKWGNRVAVYFK